MLGAKYFLENALMRDYSILRVNQQLSIQYNNSIYKIHVLECKPAKLISILGNVDLKVEFKSARNTATNLVQNVTALTIDTTDDDHKISSDLNENKDFQWSDDDDNVTDITPAWRKKAEEKKSIHKAINNNNNSDTNTDDVEEYVQCENCTENIRQQNYSIHVAHCVNQYKSCDICHEKVHRRDMNAHMKSHEIISCTLGCSERLSKSKLQEHVTIHCKYRLENCDYCNKEIKWIGKTMIILY